MDRGDVPTKEAVMALVQFKQNRARLESMWDEVRRKYPGRWVAMTNDGKIVSSKDARALVSKLADAEALTCAAIEYVSPSPQPDRFIGPW
jgi:hypothetical protein